MTDDTREAVLVLVWEGAWVLGGGAVGCIAGVIAGSDPVRLSFEAASCMAIGIALEYLYRWWRE